MKRASFIPKAFEYRYNPDDTDLSIDEISERISNLMAYKRAVKGKKRMSAPEHVFLDIETTGLNKNENIILEIGMIVTDLALQPIERWSETVTDTLAIQHLDWLGNMAAQEPNFRGQEPWSGARYVHEMHQKNGLAAEIRASHAAGERRGLAEVSHKAADVLRSLGLGKGYRLLPMTGSTILFDRGFIQQQMPVLNEAFHYRSVDISSMKILVDKYRVDLVRRRDDELNPVGAHRSLSDLDDSIDELKFYLEHLYKKDL